MRVLRQTGLVLALSLLASTAQAQDDPTETVKMVFSEHCARCHQDGSLEADREKPAGGFGYVMDLDALARNPEYVQIGNPSASEIYTRIVNQSMPKDIDYVSILGPTADELKAVATWIESLSEAATAMAASRTFIDDDTVLKAMNDDLLQLSDFERPRMRYFTLTHLYNVGDTDKEMDIYRQALSKFLNSMSTEPGIVVPEPVDEAKTVFRVDITDLGWSDATWKLIEDSNPYFVEYDSPIMTSLQNETTARVPFVRADWFAYVASQPPLYYDILDLPDTKAALERKLGLNTDTNRANLRVARAGFQQSGVSRNNRLIERHTMQTGAYWESFDFAGNRDRQSFFLHPLGPERAFGSASDGLSFVHDGGEIIFNLPNGLQAYYLTDHLGQRLDTGPTQIVQDPSRRDQAVTNGISCMSCHSDGMQFKDDQVREYAMSHSAFDKDVRKIIEEIYVPKEEMQALMKADQERFLSALKLAGVDPTLKLSGEEIVSVLFLRFERDLTMNQAAAELGFDADTFRERLNQGSSETFALKKRLEFNLVPRDQFVELFAGLVNEITDHHATDLRRDKVQIAGNRPESSKRFNLALFPNEDPSRFRVGAELTFSVLAEQGCYLTIFNVDEKKRTTVLFPNRFNSNNYIEAGRTYRVPGNAIGGFKLKFGDPGRETVIAKCNASGNRTRGIEHDFDASAFTTFASYDDYVTRAVDPRRRQIIVTDDSGSTTARPDPHVDVIAEKAVVLQVRP